MKFKILIKYLFISILYFSPTVALLLFVYNSEFSHNIPEIIKTLLYIVVLGIYVGKIMVPMLEEMEQLDKEKKWGQPKGRTKRQKGRIK